MSQKIELLAPAKDYECGVAAINHGADAVYVGAPKFGARATAGNSLADIERLCRYAHLYHASVHVALNTILTDEELETVIESAGLKPYRYGFAVSFPCVLFIRNNMLICINHEPEFILRSDENALFLININAPAVLALFQQNAAV